MTVLDNANSAELQAAVTGQPLARSNAFVINAPSGNTPPFFTKGANQTVNEDAGPMTVSGWATNILPGVASESGQSVSFLVTSDNPTLFSAGPTVQSNGTLTFTPAPNANGSSILTVRAQDNGGTASGGRDTSDSQTFTITVNSVNDAPVIIAGGNIVTSPSAGPQSINWATTLSTGPANEAAQTLDIQVANSRPGLFTVPPALAPSGLLTFTPLSTASGTAVVTVTLTDNGGLANGGRDTTVRTFTITIGDLNQPPMFIAGR